MKIITEAENFATTFYNVDRATFTWKAGCRFGWLSTQYRTAVAAWEEIQRDLADWENHVEDPESPLYADSPEHYKFYAEEEEALNEL